MRKLYFILFTIFLTTGQDSIAQTFQNDTATFNGAELFLVRVLKALEPQINKRNDDSICRVFVPLDTLKDRAKKAYCNFEGLRLSTNQDAFENFIYKIDSSCTHPSEKNIFYFRVNLVFKDSQTFGNQKPYGGYIWYKIWFDGNKYWLIPGHHNIDVCIDFEWMPLQGGMYYYTRKSKPWITRD